MAQSRVAEGDYFFEGAVSQARETEENGGQAVVVIAQPKCQRVSKTKRLAMKLREMRYANILNKVSTALRKFSRKGRKQKKTLGVSKRGTEDMGMKNHRWEWINIHI